MVPSAAASAASSDCIRTLNDNDVLLGRGIGPKHQEGNARMSLLVEERKQEYIAEKSYKQKRIIAEEIYATIHERGGRFVRQAAVLSGAQQEGFVEAEKDAGLEKIKQALREKVPASSGAKRKQSGGENATSNGNRRTEQSNERTQAVSPPATVSSLDSLGNNVPLAANLVDAFSSSTAAAPLHAVSNNNVLPPSTLLDSTSAALDSRLLLFQAPVPYAFQQHLVTNTVRQTQLNRLIQQELHQRQLAEDMVRSRLQQQDENMLATLPMSPTTSSNNASTCPKETMAYPLDSSASMATAEPLTTATTNEQDATALLDEDIFDLLRSTLGYSEDVLFTEEQEARERASLTPEERMEALSDMFGEMSLSTDEHQYHHQQRKRTRRDLDALSVKFLVNQMRLEIEDIPQDKKQALVEAQAKCRQEEFSDGRLELFLRFEGMNPKERGKRNLAAQRFVEYWNARREVFGPDKFTLPMTLSEALRDDLVALNAGVYYLLPHLDLSGRRLLYVTPWRHTRENYDTDSLLRVIWYLMEIVSQESNETGNGFNCIVFDKHTTIWDIDPKLNDRTTYFYQECCPVKAMATHICNPPLIMMLFLKPVMLALMSKDVRSRLKFHDGAEGEILQSLAKFGILPSMLPKEMVGGVEINVSEWIENRRAVELEEL